LADAGVDDVDEANGIAHVFWAFVAKLCETGMETNLEEC